MAWRTRVLIDDEMEHGTKAFGHIETKSKGVRALLSWGLREKA